jgi:hypothetical protein
MITDDQTQTEVSSSESDATTATENLQPQDQPFNPNTTEQEARDQ